jgi:hypothetical protein
VDLVVGCRNGNHYDQHDGRETGLAGAEDYASAAAGRWWRHGSRGAERTDAQAEFARREGSAGIRVCDLDVAVATSTARASGVEVRLAGGAVVRGVNTREVATRRERCRPERRLHRKHGFGHQAPTLAQV